MKRSHLLLIALFSIVLLPAHVRADLWYPTGNYLTPVNAIWGLKVPGISGGTGCLGRDSAGTITSNGSPCGGSGSPGGSSGQLQYNGAGSFAGVATTTVTCSGSASCTGFVAIGASPITISATGGSGTGLATTTPISNSNVLTYSTAGAGSAYGTATSSIGAGTGLSFSGTSGAQVGGTSGTFSVNTTQNLLKLSNLVTNGFVQTSGADGTLSSAALTSGNITTALGFTPFGGTNPLPIANGGTATSTPGIQGQTWIVGPAGVFNATSSLTVATNQNVGIGTTSPYAPLSVSGSGTSGPYAIISGQQPLLQIGSTSPTYGYLPNDRVNIIDSRNDYAAGNIYNHSSGACATADWTAANDLDSTALNFIDIGHTSSGFTGIGCANNPFTGFGANAGYVFDPNDDLILAVGGGANNKVRIFTGGYDATKERVTIDNTGAVGIGTTSPSATLAVATATSSPTRPVQVWDSCTGATTATCTRVASLASSTAAGGVIGSSTLPTNDSFFVQGSSYNSATKGTCFRSKQVGVNSLVYWYFSGGASPVQTVTATDCSGSGTTTIDMQ